MRAKKEQSFPKRTPYANFFLALKHINDASVSENVRQRFSDYVTIGLVILCILSLLAAVSIQVPTGVRLLPLLLTIGAVIFYIINRLGIMVSLTPQASIDRLANFSSRLLAWCHKLNAHNAFSNVFLC